MEQNILQIQVRNFMDYIDAYVESYSINVHLF